MRGAAVVRACVLIASSLIAMARGGAGVTPAHAQESEDPAGYLPLVEEAVREYEAGNFEEARSLFVRAHGLFPNARTHRGIGSAEFELRNYAESIAQLQAALSSRTRPLEGALRSETELLVARAQNFVARLFVDTKPKATEFFVDGLPVALAEGQPLVLKVGDHLIEAHLPNYVPEKRHVSVHGGEVERLTIVFSRPVAPSASAAPRESQHRWYKSPWLWGAVGAVAAGAVVGTVVATHGDSTSSEKPYGGSTSTVLSGPSEMP
jgi:hypothetical protein